MKKRAVNYRPLVAVAAALAAGIAACVLSDKLWVRLALISGAVFAALLLLILKKYKFIAVPLAMALGVCAVWAEGAVYNGGVKNAENVYMEATVCTEVAESANGYYFVADKLIVDGESIKGKARVFMRQYPDVQAGDIVALKGDFETREFAPDDGYFSADYRAGVYRQISASSVTYLAKGEMSFSDSVKTAVRGVLVQNAKSDTADIAMALLFNDRTGINRALYDDVKASGIAHIFSVSGLHTAILAGAVIWLMKKLKAGKTLTLIVVTAVLTAYSAICGFPSPMIRSTVMVLVFMAAADIGRQYDGLSTLAFSAIIVLLLYPSDLFNIGFQLSYLSVAGLVMLMPPIRLKLFSKLPKSSGTILASGLAANIMIYPVLAEVFGEFQIMFLLSNTLLLPLLPFIFVFTLIYSFSAVVISFLGRAAFLLDIVMIPVKLTALTMGSWGFSTVAVSGLGLMTAAYYFTVIVSTRYVFWTRRTKIALCSAVTAVCAALSAVMSVFA